MPWGWVMSWYYSLLHSINQPQMMMEREMNIFHSTVLHFDGFYRSLCLRSLPFDNRSTRYPDGTGFRRVCTLGMRHALWNAGCTTLETQFRENPSIPAIQRAGYRTTLMLIELSAGENRIYYAQIPSTTEVSRISLGWLITTIAKIDLRFIEFNFPWKRQHWSRLLVAISNNRSRFRIFWWVPFSNIN